MIQPKELLLIMSQNGDDIKDKPAGPNPYGSALRPAQRLKAQLCDHNSENALPCDHGVLNTQIDPTNVQGYPREGISTEKSEQRPN